MCSSLNGQESQSPHPGRKERGKSGAPGSQVIGCFPLQGACGTGKKVKVRVKGGGQECPLYTFSAKGKGRRDFSQRPLFYAGNDLLSHTLSRAVQSALRGLTSVFGMGTGGTPAVRSPTSRSS